MFRMLRKLLVFLVLNTLIASIAAYTVQNLYLDLDFPKNLEELDYKGNVHLQFSVDEEVDQIILDADIEDIQEISVYKNGDKDNIYKGREYSRSNQRLLIFLHESLVPLVFHSVHIDFSNKLRTDFTGFYIVQYKNEQNTTEFLMSTQLKPNYIRRAFPCFDAPDIRGLVHLTVTANRNWTVVFNSDINSKELTNGGTDFNTVTFTTTKLVPIHQISLTLLRLKSLSISNLFTYSVYGKESCHANFALNATVLLRARMVTYVFASTPTLIQIVAIPTDTPVESKAWGATIFREEDISFNELETTGMQQVQIAIQIARALARSFFSTQVVPQFWNHIWLNDGFANWLAYKIVDVAYPEWDVFQFFLINEYQNALISDGLPSTQPIERDPDDPLEYIEDPRKNAILAAKSASFLRMLEYKLGDDNFKALIREYIGQGGIVSNFKFIELFWTTVYGSFLKYSPLHDYVFQRGYSLVTIDRNYSISKINVIQSPLPDENKRKTTWLPVNIISMKNLNSPVNATFQSPPDYNERIIETEISGLKNDEWVLANYHQTGYFRTNYDERNWLMLSNALRDNHTQFQVNDRAQLLDNAFRLAELDILPYEISLNLSLYLKKEKEFSPWATADKFLASLEHLFTDHPGQQLFYRFAREITKPTFSDMSLKENNKDSIILKTSRGIVTYWACRSWNIECFCEAKKLFKKYLKDDKLIAPNVRKTVLCTGIRSAPRKELDQIWRKMFRSRRRFERFESLHLLGCSSDGNFLEDFINHIFKAEAPEDFYKHERMEIIPEIVYNGPKAVAAVIKALNKPDILEILLSDKTLVPAMHSIAEFVFTRAQESMLRDLAQNLVAKQVLPKHEYDMIIDQINKNINWVESNQKEVSDWLKTFDTSNPADDKDYSSEEQPECKLPSETRNCGCGCGCEDSAFGYGPSHYIVLVSLILIPFIIE